MESISESTIYRTYDGAVYIDSDYYLIGTDDQETKSAIRRQEEMAKKLHSTNHRPEFTSYKRNLSEAKLITLQLYEVKNIYYKVFEEKTDKDSLRWCLRKNLPRLCIYCGAPQMTQYQARRQVYSTDKMKIEDILTLNKDVLPTIPVPHDCIIKKIRIEHKWLIFTFDNDTSYYDSVRKLSPNIRNLILKYLNNNQKTFLYIN